jgi:asparagine synthase (glutamine-hydrolysing)
VKVVLCGEGGDELFMGYNRQRWAKRMGQWRGAVKALGGARFIDRLPKSSSRQLNYLREYAQKFRDGAALTNGYERFFGAVTISSPHVRARIYDQGFCERSAAPDELATLVGEYFPERDHSLSPLDEFELGDLTVHMPASLLQRLDRASMAHSLEARVPFLSHSFVDWALTMPDHLKLRGSTGKYVLRKAVEPWLPRGALKRRKLGFQMPLADWFTGDFNDFARDAWQSSGAAEAGFLNPVEVERLFDEHRAGLGNHGRLLYAIAMFSCWWKEQGPGASVGDPQPRRARTA